MDYHNLILQQLDQLDLDQLYQIAGRIENDTGLHGLTNLRELIIQILQGELPWNWDLMMHQGCKLFFSQLQNSISSCIMILLVCILSGLMTNLTESFGKHTVSKVGSVICILVAATVSAKDFMEVYHYCLQQMDLMIIAVQSLFPVLIPLILASGKAVTGTLLNPAMLSVITMIATVMDRWILPGIFISCALCIVGGMIDQSFLHRGGKLFKDVIVFSLGMTVTVLSAFTTIQSTVGKTADSLIMKTARYSVDNFIPMIGGFAADSMDMVISCTAMIKNAIGLWGVILLFLLLLFPLIKMASIILVYRCGAVLAEALEDKTIASCLDDIASAITSLAVVYMLMGILFIVFLTILIAVI